METKLLTTFSRWSKEMEHIHSKVNNFSINLLCLQFDKDKVQNLTAPICLGNNGKYWALTSDGTIAINSATPEYFLLELLKHSGMAIKPEQFDGYLGTDKSTGALVARKNTKVIWEY